MNHSQNDNTFIFNDQISSSYLTDLYGEDYLYIQEVFESVLKDFPDLTSNIQSCYNSGNISSLKAAVHKIKPVFGFVGLLNIQQQCQQFENICQSASSMEMLTDAFSLLENNL